MSAGYYPDEDEVPYVSIWQRLNRVLWALLVLTMVGFIIGSFLPELQKQHTEEETRVRLHRLIDEQRAMHTRYERQINWLQNDPEYLAIIIRDKFDMMKEGETIFRMEPAKPGVVTPELPSLPVVPRR